MISKIKSFTSLLPYLISVHCPKRLANRSSVIVGLVYLMQNLIDCAGDNINNIYYPYLQVLFKEYLKLFNRLYNLFNNFKYSF